MDNLDQQLQIKLDQARSDRERVDVLIQQADRLFRQEQFDRARGLCCRAHDLAGTAGENQQPYIKGLANSLTLLANVDSHNHPGDQSLSMFLEALALLEQVDDPICSAEALGGIAWVYLSCGELVAAREYVNRAIVAAETSQDLKEIGRTLNTAGGVLMESNDLEQSIQVLQRAIRILNENETPSELSISYNNLAMALIQTNRLVEAEAAALESLRIISSLQTVVTEAYTLDTLGLIYKEQGDLPLAVEYFKKATQYLQMRLAPGADLEIHLHLGETLLQSGALPEAEQYLLYALRFAEKFGMFRFVYTCHDKLAGLYEQCGDLPKALNHYQQFHQLKEKVFSQESIQKLANLKAMHKVESAHKDAEILRLRNAVLVQEIATEKARHAELEHLATTDALTGLFNRRHFFTLGTFELASARTTPTELCLIMIDVDHFKSVNDEYGHPIGDQVLVQLGATLNNCLRSQDVFCRYGGEEFVVLLPNSNLEVGLIISRRLLRQAAELQVQIGDQVIQVTISVGIAELGANDLTLEQLVERADVALRRAKSAGRNTVVTAPAR